MAQDFRRLESEFKMLLDTGGAANDYLESEPDDDDDDVFIDADGEAIPVARPVNDYNVLIEPLPTSIVGDLHEIARRMVVSGFGKESTHVYSGNRNAFLEESLSRLGLKKVTTDDVKKMEWSDLEDDIDIWSVSANVALRILFPSERRLCERVFSGFPEAADLCFMEVCRGSAVQILNIANAVALSSRKPGQPERLFKVIDVYETVGGLMSEFDLLFSNQYGVVLRNEAMTIWKGLGEAIRGIFIELEDMIRRDPAKLASPGGGVHPITRYVMNFIRVGCKSRRTLEKVFEEIGSRVSITSLKGQIAWIMEILESNLEANSRMYKDAGLSAVFMMNNGRYIMQKVEDSELGEILGEDWIKKENSKLGKFHMSYQKSGWSKVVGALKADNNVSVRERMNVFNTCFDEACKAQCSWIVADEQLREEVKANVAESVTSAYGKFLARFRSAPEVGRNADRLVKYSVEEVEAKINNELFQGSGGRK